jgi:flagellar hook-associated protein 1 FlgK
MSTGLSGLLAMQRALDTTSQNIANANTEGYVRQRVELQTRVAVPVGTAWVGNGVEVGTVARQVNQFLVDQSRAGSSATARLEVMASESTRVGNLLGDPSAGLSATLGRLRSAFQAVATEPASLAARQTLIGEARSAAERLRGFDARLSALDQDVNLRLRTEAGEINRLAEGIARLNRDIAASSAAIEEPPNGLLDARDRLLDELAAKVNVTTVPQGGSGLNVFIGNGQALVVGESAARITSQPDPFDATRPRVMLEGDQGVSDVTASLSGGTVGGLLDFRSQVLDPARNELGRIAAGIADAVNGQHRAGLDLRGEPGGNFFDIGAPTVLPASANLGAATVTGALDGSAALTGADYEMAYNGSSWTLRRLDSGASVPLTGAGTASNPFRADGMSLDVSGTPVAGDRYLIQPTRNLIRGFGPGIDDPSRIAAAAPIAAQAATANTGSARVSPGEVLDAANPALRSTVTLSFTSPGNYQINGAGSYPYTSGQPIELNGWRVTIDGTPAAGDQFTIRDNAGARGDNRNALALSSGLAAGRLDGGQTSLADAATGLATEVGITARQSSSNLEAETIMRDEAIAQRRSVSGVNLDEEAANLLRFQQAYQASAQLVRIANEMFQTLLDSTR